MNSDDVTVKRIDLYTMLYHAMRHAMSKQAYGVKEVKEVCELIHVYKSKLDKHQVKFLRNDIVNHLALSRQNRIQLIIYKDWERLEQDLTHYLDRLERAEALK